MSDLNEIKVTLGVEDELVAKYEQVDDELTTSINPGDHVTAKSAPIFARINRGIGYIYAGVYQIIKDTLFYHRRKTKQGHTRITKSGASRITSREIT